MEHEFIFKPRKMIREELFWILKHHVVSSLWSFFNWGLLKHILKTSAWRSFEDLKFKSEVL